jgi:hypothetical protein
MIKELGRFAMIIGLLFRVDKRGVRTEGQCE